MKMRMQDRLSLLGMIVALAACGASPDRHDADTNDAQAGAHQDAVIVPAAAAPSPIASTDAAATKTAIVQPAGARADGPPSTVPTRDRAIFEAAGLRFVPARGQWESGDCGDPPMGAYDPGAISKVEDMNSDGRSEALVTEGGACYGNTGMRFWLLSQRPGGQWKVMTDSIAIPEFLATRGADGFPDIQGGGPGFCFPVARWNGREYALNRHEYEGKPCSPPR